MIHLHKQHFVTLFIGSLLVLLLGIVSIAMISTATYARYADEVRDKDRLMNHNKSGLVLLDRDSNPFYAFYPGKTTNYIPLKNIPEHLQAALIATEDKTFYTNPGYSLKGMVRAAWVNFKSGKIVQGGSTISQGLVKNVLLSSERNLFRKVQEIVLAIAVNQYYQKPEILEMYFNSVYFGEGAVGIDAAARTYFGIPVAQLNLAQSAMLVGILPAPSDYSPFTHLQTAQQRQQLVLNQMVLDGYITKQQADQAANQKLTFQPEETNLNTYAHHFAVFVRNQLFQKYGEETVIRGGFTVRTTLKSDWQQQAEDIVSQGVKQLARNGATNGAAVIINPHSGEVLALVGSVNWYNNQFGKMNMAITPRQPGSAFKPIIYAAAFEDGFITPATILEDVPKEFTRNYKPKNYDNTFRGRVSVRRALANSLNVPAVEVMEKVGVEGGLSIAKRLGITTLKDASQYGLSLVLGTGEVSLLELTNVYATFANGGIKNQPVTYLEVKNKYDQTIEIAKPQQQRVLSEGVSFLISSILSDPDARREVFGSVLDTGRTVAVKTGTSQNYRSALTVGYTQDLAIGVWVGNNNNASMDRVAGSIGPAPIFKNLVTTFHKNKPDLAFQPPGSVVIEPVCNLSRKQEYFLSGTEHTYVCVPPPVPEAFAAEEATEGNPPDTETPPPPDPTPEPTATPTSTPTPNENNDPDKDKNRDKEEEVRYDD